MTNTKKEYSLSLPMSHDVNGPLVFMFAFAPCEWTPKISTHPIIFYLSQHDFPNPSQPSITSPLSYPLENFVPDSAPTFQLKWTPSPLRSAPRRNCSMTIYMNVTMR